MDIKLPQDATASIEGIIYQFYHILKTCSELTKGQTIYIEKYGDITVSATKQIEVKKYNDPLTDGHDNLWKTLKNWLNITFDPDFYNSLVLVTTQEFSATSTISEWNDLDKNKKLELLKKIQISLNGKNKSANKSDKLILIDDVLSPINENKLLSILDKFQIYNSQPLPKKQYHDLISLVTAGIMDKNKELYMQTLLGYIFSPQVLSHNGWEINYLELENQRQLLHHLYCKESIEFPKLNIKNARRQTFGSLYNNHLYVKKIIEIGYNDAIEKAKRDYTAAKNTICDEFSHGTYHDCFSDYEYELIDRFEVSHRKHSRNSKSNLNQDPNKDFYDAIYLESSTSIQGFSETPIEFKNGVIHLNMDDEKQNLSWKVS